MKLALLVAGVLTAGILLRELSPSAAYRSEHVENLTTADIGSRVLDAPSGHVWVLDLWAPWCGPCRQFAPEFGAAADLLFTRASFGNINLDEHPDIGHSFNVESIPTVLVVRDGKVIQRMSGGMARDELKARLEPYL